MYEQSIFENRTWSYGEWFYCFRDHSCDLDSWPNNNRYGDPEKMGKVRWRVMFLCYSCLDDSQKGWVYIAPELVKMETLEPEESEGLK